MKVDDVEVIVEGGGATTIVMIHGWPDSYRLWNAQVAALKDRYRCVRFSLPGFELAGAKRAYALDEVVETIRHVWSMAAAASASRSFCTTWAASSAFRSRIALPSPASAGTALA